ncbi:MAG: hypothetical protein HY060_17715 [Proteobacteria bacterium]|nr:hypothetical protein [Pseudomonadota bacterium]
MADLGAIERRYTMSRERAIHELVIHKRVLPATPAALPNAATAAVEDMLF